MAKARAKAKREPKRPLREPERARTWHYRGASFERWKASITASGEVFSARVEILTSGGRVSVRGMPSPSPESAREDVKRVLRELREGAELFEAAELSFEGVE